MTQEAINSGLVGLALLSGFLALIWYDLLGYLIWAIAFMSTFGAFWALSALVMYGIPPQ